CPRTERLSMLPSRLSWRAEWISTDVTEAGLRSRGGRLFLLLIDRSSWCWPVACSLHCCSRSIANNTTVPLEKEQVEEPGTSSTSARTRERHALLIVNARSRQGDSDHDPVIEHLRQNGVEVHERKTSSPQECGEEIA